MLKVCITISIFLSNIDWKNTPYQETGRMGINPIVWCFASLRQERIFRKSWHVLFFGFVWLVVFFFNILS